MSYAPAPGTEPGTLASHASLPARPPSNAPDTAGGSSRPTHDASRPKIPMAFQPRAVAAQNAAFKPVTGSSTSSPATIGGYAAPATHTQYPHASQGPQQMPMHSQPQEYPAQQHIGYGQQYHQMGPVGPSIHNPFPVPGAQAGAHGPAITSRDVYTHDADMEVQMAQWQSAYASKDATSQLGAPYRAPSYRHGDGGPQSSGANNAPLGSRSEIQAPSMTTAAITSAANADTDVAAVVTGADGKQKTVVRSGGGQTWQDPSLLEWDPAHFRLFVGNLAGEVTDESLLKAFSKYPSVQKARVVREKRTTKSKGYGFVSFVDGEEYFQAARDMQGKYIGSHPVLLRKSTTEIRPVVSKNGKKGAGGTASGYRGRNSMANGQKSGTSGTVQNSGIQKKPTKTKGGLKILG